jgi:dienelactone hydrolase
LILLFKINLLKNLVKMKTLLLLSILLAVLAVPTLSFMQPEHVLPKLKEEVVTYTADGITFKGFVAWDENISGKRPVVLVIPEWWGLNDYAKYRVRELAGLGYIAMAADMFGDGKIATNPQEAQEYTKSFYSNPNLAKSRIDVALQKLKTFPEADVNNMAAIGYCFGGSCVLNAAKLGANLKGVVSFHGGLTGSPANKTLLKAKILVCNGAADKFVSEQSIIDFRHGLDSIGADYTFKSYANATHAFTNPASTETGKKFNMPIEYNEAADKASWHDMKVFFASLFK